jgi:hypothetical protein
MAPGYRTRTRAARVAWVTWLLLVLGGWSADHGRAAGSRSGGPRATASATFEVEPDAPTPSGGPVGVALREVRSERALEERPDPAPRAEIIALHFLAAGRDSCSGTALPPPVRR